MPHLSKQRTAVGYVRVSVDDEAGNNASISSQKVAMVEYCDKEGILLLEIFEETEVSGRSAQRKRSDQMIAAATASDSSIEFVVVYAMSRFARRLETQVVAQRRLMEAGVRLVSLTEHFLDDDNGLMLTSFTAIINEKYSRDAATFTKRDRRTNARNGYFNGGRVPFGYEARTVSTDGRKERRKLFPKDAERPAVELIYELADVRLGEGPMGARAIAEHLNLKGYTLRGGPFHNSSVSGILTRTHYRGYYLDLTKDDKGRTPIEDEGIRVACPTLVDPERADLVAAIRAHRRPTVTAPRVVNGPTLLVGKARCGSSGCAAAMTIRTGKGGRYSYYNCGLRANIAASQCTTKPVRRESLDAAVMNVLVERLLQPDHLKELLARVLDLSEEAD